jgi:uncharacterized protein YukJ
VREPFDQSTKVCIFGEQFHDPGLVGMHNIHMNQETPRCRRMAGITKATTASGRTGGMVLVRADGTLHAVLTKFNSQTFNTNDQGLPR